MDDETLRDGERVVDDPPRSLGEWATLKSHLATYEWATEFCSGMTVLDYGCCNHPTVPLAETVEPVACHRIRP